MSGYDHLDIFMKMLEVLAKDMDNRPRTLSPQERSKLSNVIERFEGSMSVHIHQENTSVAGDNFKDISQSVIATRGSIAKGIIEIGERRGEEVAEAFRTLEQALHGEGVPEQTRADALELLSALTGQAATDKPSKSVMKSLGSSLRATVEGVGTLADTVGKVWPLISSIWI